MPSGPPSLSAEQKIDVRLVAANQASLRIACIAEHFTRVPHKLAVLIAGNHIAIAESGSLRSNQLSVAVAYVRGFQNRLPPRIVVTISNLRLVGAVCGFVGCYFDSLRPFFGLAFLLECLALRLPGGEQGIDHVSIFRVPEVELSGVVVLQIVDLDRVTELGVQVGRMKAVEDETSMCGRETRPAISMGVPAVDDEGFTPLDVSVDGVYEAEQVESFLGLT